MVEESLESAVAKLHQALNSLNVSLAHIGLIRRRTRRMTPSVGLDHILASLDVADRRLLVAAEQIRAAEDTLRSLHPPEEAEEEEFEREDDDVFLHSEEGADY